MTPEEIAALVARASGTTTPPAPAPPAATPALKMKTPEQGAATSVWCAVSRQLDGRGGVYCEDCNIAEPVPADSQEARGVRPWAMDPALAEKLWALSEKITGLGIG